MANGLDRHLEHIHGMKRTKNSENNPAEPMPATSMKRCTILQHVKGQDLDQAVSKPQVVEELPINAISE
jgi:hypothetical protein